MSRATLRWISGPVLRATVDGPFTLREAVRVGPQRLLGEVVSLDRDEIVVQVYEDTTGLRPGSEIQGDGLPLSVPLGPGLLGNIFDGLLRPLSGQDTAFVRPGFKGMEAATLNFVPHLVPGRQIRGGEVLGEVRTANGLMQRCLVPPETRGEVIEAWPEGSYSETDCVCVVQSGHGEAQRLSMRHSWPVRVPRPIRRRLPALAPLSKARPNSVFTCRPRTDTQPVSKTPSSEEHGIFCRGCFSFRRQALPGWYGSASELHSGSTRRRSSPSS